MSTPEYAVSVSDHYGAAPLDDRIDTALRAAGVDLGALTPADLAPLDQFHTGGRAATLELATLAGVTAGASVLDVGGGIGGPARTLAAEFGCRVTVLDLTEEFCRTGARLTAMTRLSDRVTFRHGSALEMPFTDGSFDLVWTQHSSMNIGDKERLYAEAFRVLRPGGRLALHEIMAGPIQPVHLPVPWANDPSISFLRPAEAVRALLAEQGFTEVAWVDTTAQTREAIGRMAAAAQPGGSPPPVGLHVVVPDFAVRFRGLRRNLDEDRLAAIMAVFDRP